jgi:4-amino-4-deoxy-L-arabinose transferase-like glycosyltransferase
MLERHVTLDRAMWGSEHAASLESRGLQNKLRFVFHRITKPPAVLWILGLAIIVRLVFIPFALAESRYLHDDSITYDRPAVNLLRHRVFSQSSAPPFEVETFRTPGYPVFLAMIYAVAGHNHAIVLLTQAVIGATIVGLTYATGRHLWNEGAAFFAASFTALDPVSILYCSYLLSETLFTAALLIGLIPLIFWLKHKNLRYLGLAGLGIGIATLVRPIAFYLPLMLAFFVALRTRHTKQRMIASVLVLLISFLLIVGPWLVRNYYQAGVMEIATVQSRDLLYYQAAGVLAIEAGTEYHLVQDALRREVESRLGENYLVDSERHSVETRIALRVILDHPLTFIYMSLISILQVVIGPGREALFQIIGVPSSPLIHVLSLVPSISLLLVSYVAAAHGSIGLFLKKQHAILALTVIVTVYFLVMSSGPAGYSRFRVPIVPYIALLAGYGVNRLLVELPCRSMRCERNLPK